MRRADRLFRIVQALRRGRVITARALAEELEVSERTIYRDISDLSVSGVPVRGEAGVGYTLPSGFDLPPLMFTEEEIEALVLGARMVKSWADPALAHAAGQALAKVEGVLPERLKHMPQEAALFAPPRHTSEQDAERLETLRMAIRVRHKARLSYRRLDGVLTERVVLPLCLLFWGTLWTFAAWCELRSGFRHFRIDRIEGLTVSDETFPEEPGRTLEDFFRHVADEDQHRRARRAAESLKAKQAN